MILFWLISLAHYELNCRVLQVSWQCRLRLFAESCPEQLENPATENKSVFYIAWPAEGELNIEYRPWTRPVSAAASRFSVGCHGRDCRSLLSRANSLGDLIIPLYFYLPGNYGLLFSCYMKKPFLKKKNNILVFISFHCMARMAYRE